MQGKGLKCAYNFFAFNSGKRKFKCAVKSAKHDLTNVAVPNVTSCKQIEYRSDVNGRLQCM